MDIIYGFEDYFENTVMRPNDGPMKKVILNLIDRNVVTKDGGENLLRELGYEF